MFKSSLLEESEVRMDGGKTKEGEEPAYNNDALLSADSNKTTTRTFATSGGESTLHRIAPEGGYLITKVTVNEQADNNKAVWVQHQDNDNKWVSDLTVIPNTDNPLSIFLSAAATRIKTNSKIPVTFSTISFKGDMEHQFSEFLRQQRKFGNEITEKTLYEFLKNTKGLSFEGETRAIESEAFFTRNAGIAAAAAKRKVGLNDDSIAEKAASHLFSEYSKSMRNENKIGNTFLPSDSIINTAKSFVDGLIENGLPVKLNSAHCKEFAIAFLCYALSKGCEYPLGDSLPYRIDPPSEKYLTAFNAQVLAAIPDRTVIADNLAAATPVASPTALSSLTPSAAAPLFSLKPALSLDEKIIILSAAIPNGDIKTSLDTLRSYIDELKVQVKNFSINHPDPAAYTPEQREEASKLISLSEDIRIDCFDELDQKARTEKYPELIEIFKLETTLDNIDTLTESIEPEPVKERRHSR